MPFVPPLRPARLALELEPLARLVDGRLDLLGPAFPPRGTLLLALWEPGRDPAFRIVEGVLSSRWRWEGEGEGAWVLAWRIPGAPAQAF